MIKQATFCMLFFMIPFLSRAGYIQHLIEKVPSQHFVKAKLFSSKKIEEATTLNINKSVSSFDLLLVDEASLQRVVSTQPDALEISIPMDGVWQTIQLIHSDVVDNNTIFSIRNESGEDAAVYQRGAHYYGVVKNGSNTVAAISFFEHDIIGMVSNNQGNYVVGHSNVHDLYSNEYIVYNDHNLLIQPPSACATEDDMDLHAVHSNGIVSTELITTKCVKVYIECDYQVYLDRGSNTTNAFNYATGIFNLTKALYLNDSVSTGISQIVVWSSPDPYISTTTTSDALNEFGNAMTGGFNGDLAHLFSTRGLGGGVAWVDALCDIPFYRTAVSASLGSTITPLPTYSWNANVVTHEMGHNLGSKHTHSCAWNGNNTRIDNCGGHAGYPSGSCADVLPDPPSGGTIMSYCHLVSVGVNLNLGFGPQPGNLIRYNVNNAICLTPCITCASNISVTGIYSTSVTESNTWIKSTGQTTMLNSANIKMDANPSAGYILLQPLSVNDYFLAAPSSNGSFSAQALDGCAGSLPSRLGSGVTSLSDEIETKQSIVLYPNPVSDQLTIASIHADELILSYELYSIDGKQIQANRAIQPSDQINIDVKLLSQGLYLVKLQHTNGMEILRFEKK